MLPERILNPMSQATSWIPLTLDSGERWAQFKHNLDILVVASAKPYPTVCQNTLQQFPSGDTIPPTMALISDPQSPLSLQCYSKTVVLSTPSAAVYTGLITTHASHVFMHVNPTQIMFVGFKSTYVYIHGIYTIWKTRLNAVKMYTTSSMH